MKTGSGGGRKCKLEDDKLDPTRDADLVKACEPHWMKTQCRGSETSKN